MRPGNTIRDHGAVERQEAAAIAAPCGFLPPLAARELQAASLVGTTGSDERARAVAAAGRFARRTYPEFFRNEAHASNY
jgi:hypothetical protein